MDEIRAQKKLSFQSQTSQNAHEFHQEGQSPAWASKEGLQRKWHKGQVSTAAGGVGGVCAEPPASPPGPPRVEEVAALPSCPEGWGKGWRGRHPQMCASSFWESLKLSSREQLH